MMKIRLMMTVLTLAALSACLCLSISTAAGQTDHPLGHVFSGPSPMTPEERAQRAADIARNYADDQAAAVALDAGNYATAEAESREVNIRSGGIDGVSKEVLAAALDAQGKTQEALQVYQEMADGGEGAPRILLPYALLLLNAGQWPQAVVTYEKALSRVPDMTKAGYPKLDATFSPYLPQPAALAAAIHVALGLNDNWEEDWARHTQHDKALREYQRALQLSPNWDMANYYYGYGLQRLGRTAEARAAFQKTVKIAKGDVKVAAQKALAQSKKPV